MSGFHPGKMTEAERQYFSAQMGNVLLYSTFGLLMFGPLAFGAVEPWSIFIIEAGSVLLMSLWLAKQWIDGAITVQWNPLFPPMAAFAALILFQLVFGISAYRHDTISGALLYGAYGMLCFLSSQTLLRSSQARKIAMMFAIYASFIAAISLLQGVAPNGKLYWLRQPHLGGWIYGPYVNHNHYAGLMELLVPIPLVVSLSRLVDDKERIAAGIAAAAMTGTIFLCGSRGGMLAILAEFVMLAVIVIRQKRGMRLAVTAGIFAVALLTLLTWLGGKQLTERITSISTETRSEVTGGIRINIDRDGLRMFRTRPIAGWGLGTFPVVYPQFRTFYTNFFVNEAHDDYLQLLVETGVIGFGLMIWFLVVLYRSVLRKIKNWTSDVSGAVSLACMLGFSGLLVHSILDFNLQIPANAALFYVICTIGAAKPFLQRARKRKPTPTPADELLPASEVV